MQRLTWWAFDDGHSGEQRKRLGGLCGHNKMRLAKSSVSPTQPARLGWGERRQWLPTADVVGGYCNYLSNATAFTNACKSTIET